ncbi:hypothetical protein SAMN02745885_01497 [Carboxydocella sporoproducens DSM 16521]|uniref:Heat induced stress protein YflT n=2 Tax=Carboxydocella TaxID=178898 RepID=A0A1T4Q1B9_9FIRM|nr:MULTISPECIES: hypothetical protein [Carboxydocella]AVX21223.1 hypothetical protein CFE_2057 [Carboxydocella thermautotrophica]AVX31655.1 hypothetical protein CTH_2090 [Carboxydocella thermautotrophica]SJZ97504.1 hypothetical protein SAMN02745885_01497 [Carboxydocella sporoproducens DSM 16521]
MQIEAYFGNLKRASETVARLKAAGFNKVYMDINDHYNEDLNVDTNLAGAEGAPSLAGLTLRSAAHAVDMSKSPLAAASPMASGYGRFEEIADVNCKVIVEVEEGKAEEARQLLRQEGGELKDPNIARPRIIDDADLLDAVIDNISKNI